mmetsp:Transcript_46337/g.68994  ORF Transcript_46337/g.68994 Transcript_46337/m.68994 type:complete len:106 (+) Transcript_46337:160-477(+)
MAQRSKVECVKKPLNTLLQLHRHRLNQLPHQCTSSRLDLLTTANPHFGRICESTAEPRHLDAEESQRVGREAATGERAGQTLDFAPKSTSRSSHYCIHDLFPTRP